MSDKMREALEACMKRLKIYAEQDREAGLNGFGTYTYPENQISREVEIAKAALTPSTWIPCAERLPTEADGYVWTFDADDKTIKIEPWNQLFHFIHRYDYTHWKPTGLVRPEPPEGE